MEFIVDKLSLGEREWISRQLLQELQQRSPELAERLLKRIVQAAGNNVNALGEYALAFDREGNLDLADVFYRKAVEKEPQNVKNLGDYGDFLEKQRGDMDAAESYYKRAIDADPKDAKSLNSYATFLACQRGDLNAAESHFKRAVEADPKNENVLFDYAIFLQRDRGDLDTAESYYKQLIEADPTRSGSLCNYGQILAVRGRMNEAEEKLRTAFNLFAEYSPRDAAEACFSLWLISQMQAHDAERWERCFKFLVLHGFKRYRWSFDGMLEQAGKKLSSEELEYANALALAFLDENKVPELDRFERWRKIEPLDPKSQTPPAKS